MEELLDVRVCGVTITLQRMGTAIRLLCNGAVQMVLTPEPQLWSLCADCVIVAALTALGFEGEGSGLPVIVSAGSACLAFVPADLGERLTLTWMRERVPVAALEEYTDGDGRH